MRTGGYTVQQALTFEATSVVKQSISLAKRRGHAQVTPLHVASTMLSLSNGIFRTACLQSHSHPLQCKALELCFNVELNRLPVVSSRLSVPQSPNPTISNALVAAFKRAQANQRRGSIENQQQQPPLLVVKIELEQLIISILDDPSVSRVMREAGFLSTQVKSNIEQLLSLDQEATSTTNNLLDTINISKSLVSDHVKDEDVASVLEGLIKKRRSIVVVGECLVTLENVLKEVKDKFEKGVVPNELKEVKFISIPISFVNHIDNQEVNDKLDVLRGLVRGHVYAKGVVLYVGDLNQWMIDFKSDSNIVEHVIKELGKMVCEINNGENGNCWILGIATFGTFTRCRSSHHLLENRWGLHPITLPAGSLGLSLSTERESRNDSSINTAETVTCQPLLDRSEEVQISCCPDFMQRLEHNHQNTLPMGEPCRKRNSICSSIHKESQEKSSNFSSTISSPFSSISISSYDQQFPYIPTFSPFSNTTPNSHSSSSDIMEIDYYTPRFKQFNSQNLDMLCNALEQKVPWQKHIILEISATILQCRSGMLRRKETTNAPDHIRTKKKEETWLLFCGEDSQAKERIAKELANVVFGTYSNFVSIALSSFSPTGAYSDEEGFRNKRRRDEQGSSCIRKIAQAISENPHRVIFVEGMVQVDMCSQLQIKRAIERGTIGDSLIGEEVDLSDAIIVLCTDGFRKNIQLVNLDLNISFGDGNVSEDQSEGEIGIVESVDGLIVFRQQELHEELRL